MSTQTTEPKTASSRSRVSLWIDAVGGYRLLQGEQFTVGGVGGESPADIAVRCAWSSRQASLKRSEDDFWLLRADGDCCQDATHSTLVRYGVPLELQSAGAGSSQSPKLTLHKPSQLSRTVVVEVTAPHRFVDPVDGVILMDSTLLIGPSHEHHVRVPRLSQQYVLVCSDNRFVLRASGKSYAMVPAVPLELDELTITLQNR